MTIINEGLRYAPFDRKTHNVDQTVHKKIVCLSCDTPDDLNIPQTSSLLLDSKVARVILCLHRGTGVILRHHREPVRQGDGRLLVLHADDIEVEVAELHR